jgi:hypothetical protein
MLPHMADVVSDTRARRRERRKGLAGTVTATDLGRHLDLSLTRIRVLADTERVIVRLPNGRFDADDARVRYIRWLRATERRTAKSKVDQDFTQGKAELIRLRIAEKRKTLVPADDAAAVTEKAAAIVLTAMSGMAARIGGHDLQLRRKVDQIVFETRVALANAFNKLADADGEPVKEEDAKSDDTRVDRVPD